MQGDSFCQRLVREAAGFLTEKGYCQFLCNWAHMKNQNWEERLSAWFKDTASNVWVLRGSTEEPSAYARAWVRHIVGEKAPEFGPLYEEWMKYYAREGIEAMSMGLITMQRSTGGSNWFRVDPQPEAKRRDVGEDIIRVFEAKDFLTTVQTDASLMRAVLRVNPDLRLDIRCEPSEAGWRAVSRHLRVEKGFGMDAQTDELACNFIVRCNGERTVADVLSEIASASGLDTEKITALAAKSSSESASYMVSQP
jgi:hypothetical protein